MPRHSRSRKKKDSRGEPSSEESSKRTDEETSSSHKSGVGESDSGQEMRKEAQQVRFHGQVLRRTIPYIDEKDRENVWYTPEEFEENKKREDALKRSISSNKKLSRSNRENLNAEYVLTDEQESRVSRVVDASLVAVFKEQEKQEYAFYHAANTTGKKFSLDCRRISKAYYSHSKKALKEAQVRANKHEKHLEAIGINFLGYSSPSSSPSTNTKKGILRRHSENKQKSVIKSSKRQISWPPIRLSAMSA